MVGAHIAIHIRQTVDKGIQDSMDKERKTWTAILRTIIDGILFLSRQNLSFRGHRENFDSTNKVTFLKL